MEKKRRVIGGWEYEWRPHGMAGMEVSQACERILDLIEMGAANGWEAVCLPPAAEFLWRRRLKG